MSLQQYLISHGSAGEFGRFQVVGLIDCRRGDRVVIRTSRGVELGSVLCEATPRHARMLEDVAVGELLRAATAEDEEIARGAGERANRLFEDARALAAKLGLPLEILDVEVPLDGHQVTLYYLRWAECDERSLVSALSRQYETMVALRDLALPLGASGCGRADCGGERGCVSAPSCGTGAGCSSCGKTLGKELQDYFAGLRRKIDQHHRVPLA